MDKGTATNLLTGQGRHVGETSLHTRRILINGGFVRIDGLPIVGEEATIEASSDDFGKWVTMDSVLIATTVSGQIWVAQKSPDPMILHGQETSLFKACPEGMATNIPAWDMVASFYILGRVLNPDWNPDPRHASRP